MYYLIGIRENYHPLGNAGTLITRYKSEKRIKEVAQNFKKMNQLDEVYLIETYPQKLCELSNEKICKIHTTKREKDNIMLSFFLSFKAVQKNGL